jgi:hypothetical protein
MPDDIAIIDTSSIIHLRELPITRNDLPVVLSRLTDIINTDKLVYPKEVISELGRYINPDSRLQLPLSWARVNSHHATRFEVPFETLKLVLEKVPTVNDADKLGVEEADCYVLALAAHLQGLNMQVTVLTEETHDRPDKMSMTTACGHLRLVRLPIEEFLSLNGIWIRSR